MHALQAQSGRLFNDFGYAVEVRKVLTDIFNNKCETRMNYYYDVQLLPTDIGNQSGVSS